MGTRSALEGKGPVLPWPHHWLRCLLAAQTPARLPRCPRNLPGGGLSSCAPPCQAVKDPLPTHHSPLCARILRACLPVPSTSLCQLWTHTVSSLTVPPPSPAGKDLRDVTVTPGAGQARVLPSSVFSRSLRQGPVATLRDTRAFSTRCVQPRLPSRPGHCQGPSPWRQTQQESSAAAVRMLWPLAGPLSLTGCSPEGAGAVTTCWVAGEQKQAHIGWDMLCQREVMSSWATRNAALALRKAAGSFLLILRSPPPASPRPPASPPCLASGSPGRMHVSAPATDEPTSPPTSKAPPLPHPGTQPALGQAWPKPRGVSSTCPSLLGPICRGKAPIAMGCAWVCARMCTCVCVCERH